MQTSFHPWTSWIKGVEGNEGQFFLSSTSLTATRHVIHGVHSTMACNVCSILLLANNTMARKFCKYGRIVFVCSAHRKVLICTFVSVVVCMNMGRTLSLYRFLRQVVSTHRYPPHVSMFNRMLVYVDTPSPLLLVSRFHLEIVTISCHMD